ncbi:MAG: hypothetical protein LBU91_03110 [Bacteroidales bacterium]|nr:hypothetical protein [Bacteroidales bacterium]
MKKILFISLSALLIMSACKKDNPIGDPIPLMPDYDLSAQTGASQEADDSIRSIFETYRSYILYKFTQEDLEWTQSEGTGSSRAADEGVPMDLEYVDEFLKFLREAWMNLVPEEFKYTDRLPYRIFLVKEIRNYVPTTVDPFNPDWPYQYKDFVIKDRSMIIAYNATVDDERFGSPEVKRNVRKGIHELTPAEYVDRKISFIQTIFAQFYQIQFSDDWYALTDYTNAPVEFETPSVSGAAMIVAGQRIYNSVQDHPQGYNYNAADTVLPYKIKHREQGFLPNGYGIIPAGNPDAIIGVPSEWLTNRTMWMDAQNNDKNSFEYHLFRRTDTQMAYYLETYPKIKEKWDALIKMYDDMGIDVRAIANEKPAE